MFRILRELFTADNLLKQAFDDTAEMLREDNNMFRESVHSLRHSDSSELEFDIYAADKIINKYERQVRRKVLAHMAIAKPIDVGPGLVLISVVGDVERIGDYTKNIYELATAHPARLAGSIFEEKLTETEKNITEKFNGVAEAYSNSNEELANLLMSEHTGISKWCDAAVDELIQNPPDELYTGHVVALALYIRHLKRISAHLTNIVSSVVNPFPRIGYRPKDFESD